VVERVNFAKARFFIVLCFLWTFFADFVQIVVPVAGVFSGREGVPLSFCLFVCLSVSLFVYFADFVQTYSPWFQ